MRDLIIIAIVLAGSVSALRWPWIGVMVWTWLSIMNPHRMAWGPAYDAPLAAIAAVATIVGLIFTRERRWPVQGWPIVFLAVFVLWITLSWVFGLDAAGDYPQWNKVMKIYLMTFVGLAVLHTKAHLLALTWVAAGSLALLGIKGGLFTILTGGNYRVWGPPGSFISDNNEFALALVMTIPLLRFMQMQLIAAWARHAMTVSMVLCAAAALGTHSRGALVAITAMALMLWWRGNSRVIGGLLIVAVAVALLAFMPESWTARMTTMGDEYSEDRSALGRVSAWWNAYGIANHYPFGIGFNAARPELFARFSPYPDAVHAAHSIYFQVLGNHGYVGLGLFLAVFLSAFWAARCLQIEARQQPQTLWCAQLGAMGQVALVGYAVGGAFLSLSYFDLPYIVVSLIVLARLWMARQAWLTEVPSTHRWLRIPGSAPRASAGAR
jgi:putative inorganic carbon (hco3(-)) transporter